VAGVVPELLVDRQGESSQLKFGRESVGSESRCCTTSLSAPSLEVFWSTSKDHLPLESRLNLMRVWGTNRVAVAGAMADAGSR